MTLEELKEQVDKIGHAVSELRSSGISERWAEDHPDHGLRAKLREAIRRS